MDLETFFSGHEQSLQIFEALCRAVEGFPATSMAVTKSQIAFRRRKPFAWAWIPAQYLRGRLAPLVLTISLRHRDRSPRWKEVVEPRPGRFTHHMELFSPEDVDAEVLALVEQAWAEAA